MVRCRLDANDIAVYLQIHAIQRKLIGKDIRLSGNSKISTTDTLGDYWLPPDVRQYNAQYPDILYFGGL